MPEPKTRTATAPKTPGWIPLRTVAFIAAINATQRKGIHPGVFAAVAVQVLGSGTGWYFGVYNPEVQRREAVALEAKMEAERADREAEEARDAAELEAQKRAEAEAEKVRLAEEARREKQAAAAARRAAAPSGAPKRRGGSKARKANTDDPLAGLDSL